MYSWVSLSRRAGEPEDEEERDPTAVAAAIAKLNQLYDSGKPLFTRESILYIHEQIKNPKNPLVRGDTISVIALDGVKVDFNVDIGNVTPTYRDEDRDRELVVTQPFINYEPIEHLRRDIESGYMDLYLGFCPLRVHHWQVLRNKQTKNVWEFPIASCAAVEQLLKEAIQSWEQSETCQRLKIALQDADLPCEITTVVGFACGDMAFLDGSLDRAQRSASQHALLLTLQSVLQEKNKTKKGQILCYTQDPIYNTVDKTVLGNFGIEVIDDPEGFLQVDDGSVVFSCAPNIPVKQVIADLARPAILIWSPPVVEKEYMVTDPDSPRVFEMLRQDYDEFEFLPHDHFCSMSVYIRRSNLVDTQG